MARMSQWVGMTLLSLTLVGCVSQEKYNALKLDRDQLAERLGQNDGQMQSMMAERDAFKDQRDKLLGGTGNSQALVANLTQQMGELQGRYNALNQQYQDALKNVGQAVALPKPVTDALTQFANENPDLVDFDSARGIVKFKSDITFTSGSSQLTPRASDAINRFAGILNSAAAASYELQVAGHTDNQRVMHAETIKQGHKDNWYLSAHRAISVSEALQKDGVSPARLGVMGYADQHPVADNGTTTGRAQNRRVEVLILPTQIHASSFARATPSGAIPAEDRIPSVRHGDLNKDDPAPVTPRARVFNK
jgi:chemotaxis protein MotB